MTDLDIAEKVKIEYAVALASVRKTGGRIKIVKDDEAYYFETSLVDQIVEARCIEIFELINVELTKIDRYAKLPGGVVLTGGGAELSGIAACAKETLKLNARVGQPTKFTGINDEVNSTAWSTALGLMTIDIKEDLAINKPKPKKKRFGLKKDKK
jgi:cell division protein FtsA